MSLGRMEVGWMLMVRSKSSVQRSPLEVKVVENPIIFRAFYIHPKWLFGISEPSTSRLICERRCFTVEVYTSE